jgi:hypothetical protein
MPIGGKRAIRITITDPARGNDGPNAAAAAMGDANVEVIEFPTKSRDDLDRAINEFDRNLTYRLEDLRSQFVSLGDILMAMAKGEDQKYLSVRIAAVLRSHGMFFDRGTAAVTVFPELFGVDGKRAAG